MSIFAIRRLRRFPLNLLFVSAFFVAIKLAIDVSVTLAFVLGQNYIGGSLNGLAELAPSGYFSAPASINGDHAVRMILYPVVLGLITLVLVVRTHFRGELGINVFRLVYALTDRRTDDSTQKTKIKNGLLIRAFFLQAALYGIAAYFIARCSLYIYHFYINGYVTAQVVRPFGEAVRIAFFLAYVILLLVLARWPIATALHPRHSNR
jgi:hypothetical protein